MEVFIEEEYRKKFTGLLSLTEQWTNDPMKRIQYEQGMRKPVQPNYTQPIQTNYPQQNMRYPTNYPQQNMRYPTNVTMLGGYYLKNSRNTISKDTFTKHNPHISYIYGYVNIVNEPLESTDYDKIKYEDTVDNLKFPFNYPIKESTDKYSITTKSIDYLVKYYSVTRPANSTINDCIKLIKNVVNGKHSDKIDIKQEISKIINNNDKEIFKPFKNLHKSILNFFYFIQTYHLGITNETEYIKRFSELTVCSIIMKKTLYDNFKKTQSNSILTNDTINIVELEGEIDNFFNWFIYVNKLLKNLENVDLKDNENTTFYKNYYNKKILEI